MGVHVKDPSAVLSWRHDWSAWLGAGETISTSTWSVTPSGLTIDSESETGTTTTVFLSGGTIGKVYRVVNRVTTSGGHTEERTLVVRVEDT